MTHLIETLAFIGGLGPMEMIGIAAVGLLIFGNKLPQVGRSLGRSIVEFKKGVKGIKEEIDDEMDKADSNDISDDIDSPDKK